MKISLSKSEIDSLIRVYSNYSHYEERELAKKVKNKILEIKEKLWKE